MQWRRTEEISRSKRVRVATRLVFGAARGATTRATAARATARATTGATTGATGGGGGDCNEGSDGKKGGKTREHV